MTAVKERSRLDVHLVDTGAVESRQKAQALVMAGRVLVDGRRADKPGSRVAADAAIEIAPGPTHVGRGALKLGPALDHFGVDPTGFVCVDVGASTGGFTEVLLARGAARVYAVDVGRGQLHEKLARDSRVVVVDRFNARHLSQREVPEPCALGVVDVSFISVCKILPALLSVSSLEAELVVLVKPQFELERGDVGRGGVVREPALHQRALTAVAECARTDHGLGVAGAAASAIKGARGNREFFLHLTRVPVETDHAAIIEEAARE